MNYKKSQKYRLTSFIPNAETDEEKFVNIDNLSLDETIEKLDGEVKQVEFLTNGTILIITNRFPVYPNLI